MQCRKLGKHRKGYKKKTYYFQSFHPKVAVHLAGIFSSAFFKNSFNKNEIIW